MRTFADTRSTDENDSGCFSELPDCSGHFARYSVMRSVDIVSGLEAIRCSGAAVVEYLKVGRKAGTSTISLGKVEEWRAHYIISIAAQGNS